MARGMRAILEDVIRMRIKGKPSKTSQIPVAHGDEELVGFLQELEGSQMVDMSEINKFRTLSTDREAQYRMYDEMALDSIISSAIEMYADDATQYNSNGQIIWAESDDSDVSAFANRLIDILDLNSNAWSHIYSMVKYGDIYLETFRDDEIDDEDPLVGKDLKYAQASVKNHKNGSKMEEYIEFVANPSKIFDLVRRGKTVGFIDMPINDTDLTEEGKYGYQYIQKGNEINVMPADKYVHICLANDTDRYSPVFKLSFKGDNGDTTECKYKIKRGKSILHDIYKVYKEISLMEDSLLLNRVTKSSLIRILQIEVGDMPKSQARETLKRIKQLIEQKNFMDKTDSTYSSMASPGPIENVIYVPTRNGKGNISSSNLGGDVDVKSIVDIDYFKNKLYAGLKIPKQFLGEDDGGGFSGGTSLTKLDSRYARTIKRVQNSYISGITTLINLFAISKGLTDHVNSFTVKMQSPSTVEDGERDAAMSDRINIIGSFIDILSDLITNGAKKEVITNLINNMLNLPDIAKIIEDDVSEDDIKDESPGFTPSEVTGNDNIDNFSDDTQDNDVFAGIDDVSEPDNTTDTDDNFEVDDSGFGNFTDEV